MDTSWTSAADIAGAVAAGRVSAVQVTEDALARITARDPVLNSFTDVLAERARKRGIMVGKQEFGGMSRLSGLVTPELRAAIESMLAKLAAPGACNPADETPVVDATPDEDAARRDHRSSCQTGRR